MSYNRHNPLLSTLLVALCLCTHSSVQESKAEETIKPYVPTVVARVNGSPIYEEEVTKELAAALGGRPVTEAMREKLKAPTLEKLIDRRLILQRLQKRKEGVSDADVDLAVTRLKERLTARGRVLKKELASQQMNLDMLRYQLAWDMSWEKHLARALTEENLKKYFEKNRRHFDGSTIRTAHIVLPVGSGDEATVTKQAQEILAEIKAGTITFEEAAKKYSKSPSAAKGGDIGFISRHQPMPENFSKAVFSLEPNAVGGPVVTVAGVHLVKNLETKKGDREFEQLHSELVPSATLYIFQWLSRQQRPGAKIEYVKR